MVLIIGLIVVLGSVWTGFSMAGGHVATLLHMSELITIGGAALGALIIMSPPQVIKDILRATLQLLKGSPYGKSTYRDLLKSLYLLAAVVRRDGLLALEAHFNEPKSSSIFQKAPRLAANPHAMHFLTNGLAMIVDGMDAKALTEALDDEIKVIEREHHLAISALTKTADALPGFGIVAAVLGIVVTMGHIDGPVEEIGHKVGAALVGTFLGILLSYGFFAPLAGRMEVSGEEEKFFFQTVTVGAAAIQQGASPKEVVNRAMRQIGSNCRPTPGELKDICSDK
jgi:chemotaxis protein MotA